MAASLYVLAASLAFLLYAWLPERPRPPHVVYHGDVKFLVHRHTIFGAVHSHNPHDLHLSGWAVQAAASYMRPGSKVAFVAGVGAGSVVKELRHRHLEVRAVEIDPGVARLARHEFGVGCSPGDAVDVIEHVRAGSHDLVLVDAFDGLGLASTWRFLRTETMRHVKASFKNETTGLLVINVQVAGEGEADDDVLHRAAAIIAHTYDFVKAFRDAPAGLPGPYNVVFFASDSPVDAAALRDQHEGDWVTGSEHWVVRNFHEWEILECTPAHCEGLAGNYPKTAPGPEYDAKLLDNLRAWTASHVPAELVFRPAVALELRLGSLLAVAAAWSFHGRARRRGKTD